MSTEPTLTDDRRDRRREHLMREITLTRPIPSSAPAAASGSRGEGWTTWRRSLAGGLAAATAAVAVLAVAMSGSPPAPAAFAFEPISSETVAVRIINTTVDAAAMTAQLHEQGLNASIEALPASPQLVGTWLTYSLSAGFSPSVDAAIRAQFVNGYLSSILLPTRFQGRVSFGIGVPPAPGQKIQVLGIPNALAPGGRLGCLHATGGDPGTVRAAAQSWGYTVSWAEGYLGDLTPVQLPSAGQRVIAARIDDRTPDQVQLVVAAPDASRRYLAVSRMGYGRLWDTRATNTSTCVHP
jgi:hypothetical protein